MFPSLKIIQIPFLRIVLISIILLAANFEEVSAILSDNLTGNISLSGVRSSTDLTDRSSLREEASGSWFKSFNKYVTARSSLRYYKYKFNQDEQVELWNSELIPAASIHFGSPSFSASLGGRRRQSEGTSPTDRLTSDEYDISARTLMTHLPMFSLRYDWRHVAGQPGEAGRNIRDQRLQVGADYSLNRITTTYRFSVSDTRNYVSQLETVELQHLFRLAYSKTMLESNRLRLSSNYTFSRRSQTDRLPGTEILLQSVPIVNGLYEQHDNATSGQLRTIPTLSDGDTFEPADPPIDIGTGMLPLSIGADFGIGRAINALYLYTNKVSDPTVGWRVYVSDDNFEWELYSQNPKSRFDASVNRYELVFDSVVTRYVKLVNSGFNQAANVLITEIVGMVQVASQRELKQQQTAHFIDLSSSYRPTERITMMTDLSLYREPSVGLSGQRNNVYHSASVKYNQSESWSQTAQWQNSWQSTKGVVQDVRDHSMTYSIAFEPINTFSMSMSTSGRLSYVDGERDTRELRVHFKSEAEPLIGLKISGESGFGRDRRSLVLRTTDTYYRRLTFDALALRALTVNASYYYQKSVGREGGTRTVRDQYEVGFTTRLSRQMRFNGQVSWSEGNIRYRTWEFGSSWSISSSVSLGSFYRKIEGESGLISERYNVSSNVKLSRRTSLFSSYVNNDYSRMDGNSVESVQVGLRMGF